MKTFIINKATEEKVEVSLCNLDGKHAWITKDNKQIICNVDDVPVNLQVVHDTTDDKVKFGKWLTATYKAKGWKKSKLCDAAGITRKSFILLEQGEVSANYDTLVRLCSILGATFNYPIRPKDIESPKTN